MSKLIIGVVGVKGSGKDTVANIIMGRHPDVKRVALADKLKDVCSLVSDVPRDHFDDRELKEADLKLPVVVSVEFICSVLRAYDLKLSSDDILKKYHKQVLYRHLTTPRQIAQIVGTEILRKAASEDIHCEHLDTSSDITVVPDLRFPNEFDYFNEGESFKFIPIYVKRDEVEKYVTKDSHDSEKKVFEFNKRCIEVENNNTLDELGRNSTLHHIFNLIDIHKEYNVGK